MRYEIEAWSVMPDGTRDEIKLAAKTRIGYELKRLYCMLFYDYIATTLVF